MSKLLLNGEVISRRNGASANVTPVIFRKYRKGGDIVAVFPYDPTDINGYNMTCYEHNGQHGSCSTEWMRVDTIPATASEYQDLLRELVNVGYDNLKIISKTPSDAYSKRKAEINRTRNGVMRNGLSKTQAKQQLESILPTDSFRVSEKWLDSWLVLIFGNVEEARQQVAKIGFELKSIGVGYDYNSQASTLYLKPMSQRNGVMRNAARRSPVQPVLVHGYDRESPYGYEHEVNDYYRALPNERRAGVSQTTASPRTPEQKANRYSYWAGQGKKPKSMKNGASETMRNGVITDSSFTRINNDVNGNPRYVLHFLDIANDYEMAVRIAKKLGGKKFHNKQYGGGIVFQSYNIDVLAERLNQVKEQSRNGAIRNGSNFLGDDFGDEARELFAYISSMSGSGVVQSLYGGLTTKSTDARILSVVIRAAQDYTHKNGSRGDVYTDIFSRTAILDCVNMIKRELASQRNGAVRMDF